jgi:hypothetical protein
MEKGDLMAFTTKVADDEHTNWLNSSKLPSVFTRYRTYKQRFTQASRITKIVILSLSFLGLFFVCATLFPYRNHVTVCRWPETEVYKLSEQRVQWRPCGEGIEGYDCTNITVPLDYETWNDEPYSHPSKTMTIAITRFKATDSKNRYVIVGSWDWRCL